MPRTPWQFLISLGATNPHPRNFFFNPRKDITFVAKSSSTWRLVIARYDWLTKIYLNIEFRISIDPPGRAFLQTTSTRIIAVLLGWPSCSRKPKGFRNRSHLVTFDTKLKLNFMHVHQVLVYIWRIIELELSCFHVWLMSH